jgi:hypothetical protein
MNWRDLKLKSWVTSEGEVAKQEAPFGLTLIREEGRPATPEASSSPPASADKSAGEPAPAP